MTLFDANRTQALQSTAVAVSGDSLARGAEVFMCSGHEALSDRGSCFSAEGPASIQAQGTLHMYAYSRSGQGQPFVSVAAESNVVRAVQFRVLPAVTGFGKWDVLQKV